MMVPMMVNSPDALQGGAAAFQMPFMQQPHMFMPAAAVTAAASAPPSSMIHMSQSQVQSQLMSQSQMQPQQMPLMTFLPSAASTSSPSAPSAQQPQSPQLNGQKQPANVNGGGNLAHCA